MKIAFVSFDFGEYCVRLANALAGTEEVLLLLPEEMARPHLSGLHEGIRFRGFDKPRLRQPLRQLRLVNWLRKQIEAFEPDVIHVQQGHLWFNMSLPFLRKYPLVITMHDAKHHPGDRGAKNTPQAVYDWGFRKASQVIVHATQVKTEAMTRLPLPDNKLHVIPHIVLGDTKTYPQVPEVNGTILFFGRIWPYKGLDYLIRAAPLIRAEVPHAKIVIAGEGEDFERYRRMMDDPASFTVYNEFVSDAQRALLVQQASVVVLPYIEASQSGVIPIAYTYAKPVVATTVGGLPDMVEHNQTGCLVPARNERALADAVLHLLKNEELRHAYGMNGKRKIQTECSPEVIARQTLTVYRQATRAKDTSSPSHHHVKARRS